LVIRSFRGVSSGTAAGAGVDLVPQSKDTGCGSGCVLWSTK